jgi:hypothetical protein
MPAEMTWNGRLAHTWKWMMLQWAAEAAALAERVMVLAVVDGWAVMRHEPHVYVTQTACWKPTPMTSVGKVMKPPRLME